MDALTGIKPRRRSTFRRKAERDFWKNLEQDELDGVWHHQVLFDTRHQV